MSPLLSLLLLLLAAAVTVTCRELENVGAQGYPRPPSSPSWRYLVWYAAFSGFFTFPRLHSSFLEYLVVLAAIFACQFPEAEQRYLLRNPSFIYLIKK